MQGISIIIPTYNEEENVLLLIQRVIKTLDKTDTPYEIIIVDDHSTDKTVTVVKKLTADYPVSIYEKKGKTGKAFSILEGSLYCAYDIIGMIDADLQYPPEAFPYMLNLIEKGNSLVIGRREDNDIPILRKATSSIYSTIFNKWLHGLPFDVQSGMKVFRKELLFELPHSPTGWTLDLPLVIFAKNTGRSITEVTIPFSKRSFGKSKVTLFYTSLEIAKQSLYLKLHPFTTLKLNAKNVQSFWHNGTEFVHYSFLDLSESAFFRLNSRQELIITLTGLILLAIFAINWHDTLVGIIALLTVFYFVDLLFNLFLVFRNFAKTPEISISSEDLSLAVDRKIQWPTYTILCPLYKEGNVLPQFISAIERLDYPKNKLQVLLLLEEDDKKTIRTARLMNLPRFVNIVIVPNSLPKTKPKALNYGLRKSVGKFTVIYDAEDIPEPLQLKKIVLAFDKSVNDTVCIQAKLNFYNPHQNLLTKIFTAEYSLWFDLVLTGLQSLRAPIPLGGTSNHFRTSDLLKLKGWDSFNVTEDCDLGMRIAKKGMHTAIVNSTTLEEANSSILNWFGQRGRWIKGYMQTYLVHIRNPKSFEGKNSFKHLVIFQLIVGGKIFSMLINPILWAVTIIYFTFRAQTGSFIESFFPGPIFYMGVISLFFGNFLYLYYYMIGAAKRGHFGLIKYSFFVPLYWLAMSVSAWSALYRIITSPYYWAKTKHGLHLKDKNLVSQTQNILDKMPNSNYSPNIQSI